MLIQWEWTSNPRLTEKNNNNRQLGLVRIYYT